MVAELKSSVAKLARALEDANNRIDPQYAEYYQVSVWPQIWGSTALGFGGIGGCAITTDYTVVVYSHQSRDYLVYFGGRFAYRVECPNEEFNEDFRSQRMKPVYESGKYKQEPTHADQ